MLQVKNPNSMMTILPYGQIFFAIATIAINYGVLKISLLMFTERLH